MRAVLAIGLAVAQCMSWSAPAIYLCICRNGDGVCLDAGPGTCRCAVARGAGQADACDDRECCDGRDTCPCSDPVTKLAEAAVSLVGSAPGDCLHIQLSWSQPPSLTIALNQVDLRGNLFHDAMSSPDELDALTGARIADVCSTDRQAFAVDPPRHVNPANLRC